MLLGRLETIGKLGGRGSLAISVKFGEHLTTESGLHFIVLFDTQGACLVGVKVQ